MIRDYGKIYAVGSKDVLDIFTGPVVVQEKIDGSQIAFGVFEGELKIRSRGADIQPDPTKAPNLFKNSVSAILRAFDKRMLNEGWVYRGEALAGKRHNHLTYDREAKGCIVLFDVQDEWGEYQFACDTEHTAVYLGFEPVQTLHEGKITTIELLDLFKNAKPALGGKMMEGVVVKNYALLREGGEFTKAKYVSDEFKERAGDQKAKVSRPTGIQMIVDGLATEARYRKAVQHLREQGLLKDSPADIGPLLCDLQTDLLAEESDYIKEALFKAFIKDVTKGVSNGFPLWYKTLLTNQLKETVVEQQNEDA